MNESQLYKVAKIVAELFLTRGTSLFQEGESNEMYILTRGKLTLSKNQGDKRQVLVVTELGEIIGEMEVIGNLPRLTGVRVEEEAHLLTINNKQFFELIYEHPDICDQVIKMLVHKMVDTQVLEKT